MDITNFDLQGLQLLHLAVQSALKSHKTYLESRRESGEISEIEEIALLHKITYYEELISQVVSKISGLSSEKLRISLEYVFWYFGLPKRLIQVDFLTTSKAYKKYGPYVTGKAMFDEDEMETLMKAVQDGRNSDGRIRFQELESGNMPIDVREELKSNGFMASEIDSIGYVN